MVILQKINYFLFLTHLVKTLDKAFVIFLAAFNHASERVRKPFLKVSVRLEHIRHQKVHQRPQLHQTILKWCSR